jgi:nucleoside-diphosphate kinase
MEKTLVLLKPDTTGRNIIGSVLGYFERECLKIVQMKSIDRPPLDLCRLHYIEHADKSFFSRTIEFLHSGLVIAVIFSDKNAIQKVRKIIGAADPAKAALGTIRGDLTWVNHCRTKLPCNLVHGSDSVESAAREIGLWFPGE